MFYCVTDEFELCVVGVSLELCHCGVLMHTLESLIAAVDAAALSKSPTVLLNFRWVQQTCIDILLIYYFMKSWCRKWLLV